MGLLLAREPARSMAHSVVEHLGFMFVDRRIGGRRFGVRERLPRLGIQETSGFAIVGLIVSGRCLSRRLILVVLFCRGRRIKRFGMGVLVPERFLERVRA